MKNLLLSLVAAFALCFSSAGCLSTGAPDWPLIGQQIEVAAYDIELISELDIAENCREDLVRISEILAQIAPAIASGEGGYSALEALDHATLLIDLMRSRDDVSQTVKDVLFVTQLVLNHAVPFLEPPPPE